MLKTTHDATFSMFNFASSLRASLYFQLMYIIEGLFYEIKGRKRTFAHDCSEKQLTASVIRFILMTGFSSTNALSPTI